MQRSVLYLALSTVIALSACGKSGDSNAPAAPANAEAPNGQDGQSAKAARQAAANALQTGDAATPDAAYAQLSSGNQIMFLFLALNALPIDYERIAQGYSIDYRSTTDEFKRHDILQALKPKIDAEVAQAKSHRYFHTELAGRIGHYDFNRKGFPVETALDPGTTWYVNDNAGYHYAFTNGEKFAFLPMSDEQKAREVEALQSKYPPMKIDVYGFAQDADPGGNTLKVQIMSLRLLAGDGHELVRQ